MLKKIKKSIKILLDLDNIGDDINVLEDDIFIVSYPKSGNTWTRFIVANLIYNGNVGFHNIESIVPDIYQNNYKFISSIKSPRFLKSHNHFSPKYKRVIYIVRDPRDIVISYYYHKIKFKIIPDNYSIDEFVNNFINGELDDFGSWGENVGSWIGAREYSKEFLLIRYEDLLLYPDVEIKKIADFLNLKKRTEDIEQVIRNSSFNNMKNMEKNDTKWNVLKNSRKDMNFVRQGGAGIWKSDLSKENSEKISLKWEYLMKILDYK